MSYCHIQLRNNQKQYQAGDLVEGRVICFFNSPKTIREITLKLTGEERNQWKATEKHYDGEDSNDTVVTYSGHNIFLRWEKILIRAGKLDSGRYEYPFSCRLPDKSPGTYRGPYGGISYALKAKVNRPFKFDFKAEKQIVVVSPIHLNVVDNLGLKPVVYSDEKTLFRCCWSRGFIAMDVYLEKEAYVVGEAVKVRVDINNRSKESVLYVNVQLRMEIISRVTSPSAKSKSYYELLAIKNGSGVRSGDRRKYYFELEIPASLAIPSFSLCQLFSKRVQLEVTAILPGCQRNMQAMTYLALGHTLLHVHSRSATNNRKQGVQDLPPPYIRCYPRSSSLHYQSSSNAANSGLPTYGEAMSSSRKLKNEGVV